MGSAFHMLSSAFCFRHFTSLAFYCILILHLLSETAESQSPDAGDSQIPLHDLEKCVFAQFWQPFSHPSSVLNAENGEASAAP